MERSSIYRAPMAPEPSSPVVAATSAKDKAELPTIQLSSTFDSIQTSICTEERDHDPDFRSIRKQNSSESSYFSANGDAAEVSTPSTVSKGPQHHSEGSQLQWIVYLSTFSVFGTVLRIFLGRFFGLDCENGDESVQDWLTPISSHFCITSSGLTSQTGGALFTDLPANMLGSFLIGLVIPRDSEHRIPWFRSDHPLQRHPVFHKALVTGFCGSLTTFSSWNTQMIVMIVGKYTVLGPQIPTAIFGYLLGTVCAVACFLFGQHVHHAWIQIHASNQTATTETDVESLLVQKSPKESSLAAEQAAAMATNHRTTLVGKLWAFFTGIDVAPFLLLVALFAAFACGDVVYNDLFYRKVWLSLLMTPLGALLRWELSKGNDRKGFVKKLEWVPWGTFAGNMIACFISLSMEGFNDRYVYTGLVGYEWVSPVIGAIETGFAGSLSTVSTWVKEMMDQERPQRLHIYAFGSILCAIVIGLVVYIPIIFS